MQSSRMRTVLSSSRLSGGGSGPGGRGCLLLGGHPLWGVSALGGGVSAPGGGIPACTEADNPPPRVDRQTPVKT